jgi:DNA polymerase III epsilon subunit-like protein
MKTVYFDLETGGLNDEPTIQLAAVAVNGDWTEAGAFEQKIQFDASKCSPEALKLNGYEPELWKDAVSPQETVRRFSAFLKPHATVEMISKRTGEPYMVARLAGYNALTFDLPRLRAMYGTNFFPCSYHVRDVLQRAMFYFDEHPTEGKPKDLKLTTLCEYFGIDVDGSAHEALTDARLCVALHRRLVF